MITYSNIDSSIISKRSCKVGKSANTSVFPITAKSLANKFKNTKPQDQSKEKLKTKTTYYKNDPRPTTSSYKLHIKQQIDTTYQKGTDMFSRNKNVKKSKSISNKETKFSIKFNVPITKTPNDPGLQGELIEDSSRKLIRGDDYFSTCKRKLKKGKYKQSEIYLSDNEFGVAKFEPNTAKNRPNTNPMKPVYEKTDLSDDTSKDYDGSSKRSTMKGNIWNSTFLPHGGGLEKPHNEERLNVQTNEEVKFEPKASFDEREKSVDLTMKYGSIINNHHSMLTEKLINSNKLSKYLTGTNGKKDYRTTEQREVDKCTFNPKVYSKHRRCKAIKIKLPLGKNNKGDNRSLPAKSYYTESSKRMSPTASVLKASLSSKKHTYSV